MQRTTWHPLTDYTHCPTYKNVVLNPDEMTASKISRWKRGHKQLFIFPVVRFVEPDFSSANGRQLSGLSLDHFAARYVLNGLKRH